MLLDFQVKNYRSFRDEQHLTMIPSRDRRHTNHVISSDSISALKTVAIYGANASGKSNLFSAFRLARRLVADSATRMNAGDPIEGVEPFRLDNESATQPSEFAFQLLVQKTKYIYGFSLTRERIISEWLFSLSESNRKVRWYERDAKSGGYEWKFGSASPLTSVERKLLEERTRENGLALSRGAEMNVESLQSLFLWFRNDAIALDMSRSPEWLVNRTAERVAAEPAVKEKVLELLRQADLRIEGLRIEENDIKASPKFGELREMLSDKALSLVTSVAAKERRVGLLHRKGDGPETVEFDINEESRGTLRFFALAGPLIDCVIDGGTIFIDELDCSLHPLLTRSLVDLFQGNSSGAQLIFNTHDTSLMHSDLLRRDQVWMVERNDAGSSALYSLYDIREAAKRSTEQFERNYLSGRYGGIPQLSGLSSRMFRDEIGDASPKPPADFAVGTKRD